MAFGALSVFLYREFCSCYRLLQELRLDPTNAAAFTLTNQQIRPLRANTIRIVFGGDSRIVHWNPLFSLPNCQVLNRGISGETTAQTFLRLDRDIIQLEPSIVVVQVGINDLKTIGVFPERKDEIINLCWQNLSKIVGRLTSHNIHVVILTVFPPGPVGLLRRPIWSDEINDAVVRINELIRGLKGPRVTVIDCDSILSVGKTMKPQYTQDTLHLTSAGYEAVNKSLTPILVELTRDRLKSED